MKKFFLYLVLLSATQFALQGNWEWIYDDSEGNKISNLSEIKVINDEVWLSTTTDVFRYESGQFVSKNAQPVVEELLFCNLKGLLADDFGNIIGRNNRGIAWYNGTDWNTIGDSEVNNILFNRGITLTPNDTLVLTLISKEMVKFHWDYEKKEYLRLNSQKINLPEGETQIGTGGALITEVNKSHKGLFSTNSSLNLLEFSSGNVENINQKVGFDNSNILVHYGFFETELTYYFNYANKDSSASLIALSKDLINPALHLNFKHPEWDVTQITSVTDYKNEGIFYALGDRLYFTNLKDTLLIEKPKILGEDEDNIWYINSMDIDENDTLWVATLTSGVFKSYIPDLLKTTSVENPNKQWGLAGLTLMNTFPNPIGGSILNIEVYVASGEVNSLKLEIFDIKTNKHLLNSFSLSNPIGNVFNLKTDISSLRPGIYFLKISNGETIFAKFIKQ